MMDKVTLQDGTVRLAIENDVGTIARIHTETWRNTYPDLADPSDVAARQRMWSGFLLKMSGAGALLVAELSGQTRGFIAAGPAWGDKLGTAAEVYAVYVEPEAQRKNVGCALMAESAQRLSQRGLKSLGLWVRDTNTAAQSFYRRLGGVPSGTKTEQVGDYTVNEVAIVWSNIDRVSELRGR